MIDPDLKNELDNINLTLEAIKKKSGPSSLWRSFFSGVMSALGYVVGIAIVVVIVGWILQKTGLLPAFKEQVKTFTDLVNQAKKFTSPSDSSSSTVDVKQNSGGESVITLPDGRQVKVQLTQ